MQTTAMSLRNVLQRVVDVKDEEIDALFWSCAFFFCVLAAYYIIRPMRDEMGLAGGIWNLRWLYLGTLTATLTLHPLFAALVARLPRKRAISFVYRFFLVNLLIFFFLLKTASESVNIWIGRVFFIWVAVLALYNTSVFWSFLVDIFDTDQSKRLFGFIGMGGTLGGIAGSGITALLAVPLQPVHLILFSVVLFELAVRCMQRLSLLAERLKDTTSGDISAPLDPVSPDQSHSIGERGIDDSGIKPTQSGPDRGDAVPVGGGVLSGIANVFRSPYILGICVFMLLYTITSTILYMQQAEIVDQNIVDRAVRTAFFARIDLAVNVLTLLTQMFLTGRIIKALGVGLTLALLPLFCIVGFSALGTSQTLAMIVVFQTVRRAGNYAIARPARETLWTVVSREDKYKAKNFVDVTVYRAGDQVGVWSQWLLHTMGLSMSALAFSAVPVAGVWLLVALWLGRKQTRLLQTQGVNK